VIGNTKDSFASKNSIMNEYNTLITSCAHKKSMGYDPDKDV